MPPKNGESIIVVVTVNSNETHALLDEFIGEGQAPSQKTIAKVTYNDLGEYGGNRIIHTICEMGSGGIGASQQRVNEAILHWQPKAVVAVGVAFGMDEAHQDIGNVLVSRQLQDYELGRISADGTVTPRGDKATSSPALINRLRQTDLVKNRASDDWPKLEFGLVLSGQKLIDNLDYRNSLKKLFSEAVGGEMEGTGLYVSASTEKVDWIIVKGICDWGCNKNSGSKEANQKIAAKNAARVLKAALDIEGLYNQNTPSPESDKPISRKDAAGKEDAAKEIGLIYKCDNIIPTTNSFNAFLCETEGLNALRSRVALGLPVTVKVSLLDDKDYTVLNIEDTGWLRQDLIEVVAKNINLRRASIETRANKCLDIINKTHGRACVFDSIKACLEVIGGYSLVIKPNYTGIDVINTKTKEYFRAYVPHGQIKEIAKTHKCGSPITTIYGFGLFDLLMEVFVACVIPAFVIKQETYPEKFPDFNPQEWVWGEA